MERSKWILTALLLLGGCATSFTGDAHFPGGAGGCFERCQSQRMVMDSFVYLGEYSSGCVCRPAAQGQASAGAAGAGAGAIGVVMQMREAERRRNAQARAR